VDSAPSPAHAEIEVALLGPIEVRGAAQGFVRSAARELVAYLACHRAGACTETWGGALWPSRAVSGSTLHSTASAARRALGRSAQGAEHLPRTGRRLRLADSVGTDVEQLAQAAAAAEPTRWKDALGLVRGPLFAGLRLADWAVLDGTQAEIEALVVRTALRGAGHFLECGRPEDAIFMLRRALRVSPYDEHLYRGLLRAEAMAGNPRRLQIVMSELLCVASDGQFRPPPGDPLGAHHELPLPVHPDTVALFRQLALVGPVAGGPLPRL
jgi:DNA-binding SARP family transcriptional activator